MNATHYFHKITMYGSECKFSAWFKGDPRGVAGSLAVLVDAVRIDKRGREYPVTKRQRDVLVYGPWSAGQAGTFDKGSE